jgi:hypothetical protein
MVDEELSTADPRLIDRTFKQVAIIGALIGAIAGPYVFGMTVLFLLDYTSNPSASQNSNPGQELTNIFRVVAVLGLLALGGAFICSIAFVTLAWLSYFCGRPSHRVHVETDLRTPPASSGSDAITPPAPDHYRA